MSLFSFGANPNNSRTNANSSVTGVGSGGAFGTTSSAGTGTGFGGFGGSTGKAISGGGGGAFGGFGAGVGAGAGAASSSSGSTLSNVLGGLNSGAGVGTGTGTGTGTGLGIGTNPNEPIVVTGPPAPREILRVVCLPESIASGSAEKSFEELRIDDYIQFYQSTGRPPPPVSQVPTSQTERAAQGLPPLFEPQVVEESKLRIEVEELPEWQVFTPVHVNTNGGVGLSEVDQMHCISAMPTLSGFCCEELRYYAYLKGRIVPPPEIIAQAQAQEQAQQQQLQPAFGSSLSSSLTLKSNGIQFGGDTNETYLSITWKPEFALHSFEELRVAYMQAGGREVTSHEILGIPPTATSSSSASTATPTALTLVPSTPAPLTKTPTLVIPQTPQTTNTLTGFGSMGPAAVTPSSGGGFSFGSTSTPTFKFG